MMEIVGVVRNSKYVTVGEEPRPFLFFPFEQEEYSSRMSVLLRVDGILARLPPLRARRCASWIPICRCSS